MSQIVELFMALDNNTGLLGMWNIIFAEVEQWGGTSPTVTPSLPADLGSVSPKKNLNSIVVVTYIKSKNAHHKNHNIITSVFERN